MKRADGNKSPPDTNGVKDHVVMTDGHVFYPCQFCNKVFPNKKARTFHFKTCAAKDYILSVDNNTPIPKSSKIDIQQNIVLNEQMDVSEILKSKSPPIKLTIRRTYNGDPQKADFTVSNIVLKEQNKSEDLAALTKRLESNAVTLIKQPIKDVEAKSEDESEDDDGETSCRVCTKEFNSPLELLRHSRKCHSYPKVLMAMSEVKKFYAVKDRSKCPICNKPLKTNFRSAFVKHLHTHTNEMKYSCHVCNKKFRRSDHMKAHEKRHIKI